MPKYKIGYKVISDGKNSALPFVPAPKVVNGWCVPNAEDGHGPLAVFKTFEHARAFALGFECIYKVAYTPSQYKEQWTKTPSRHVSEWAFKNGRYSKDGYRVQVLIGAHMPEGKILVDAWYPLGKVK
jgi:hypothetical protein